MMHCILHSRYPCLLYWGGVTAAISLKEKPVFSYKVYLQKKARQIVFPYFIATCGYVIFELGYLDVFYMTNKLLTFSEGAMNGHMYYLSFYLELIIIAPIVVKLYKSFGQNEWMQACTLCCSAVLAYLFQHYTYLEKFALGGKFLFGGGYFFLFNLGIYIYFHIGWFQKTAAKIIIILAGTGMLGYMLYKQWMLAWWSNPPCVKLMIYAVTIFFLGYGCITLLQQLSRYTEVFMEYLMAPFCVIGRYSLYIYLWHMLLVAWLESKGVYYRGELGIVEKLMINCFVLYFPCLICFLYKKGVKKLSQMEYWKEKPDEDGLSI